MCINTQGFVKWQTWVVINETLWIVGHTYIQAPHTGYMIQSLKDMQQVIFREYTNFGADSLALTRPVIDLVWCAQETLVYLSTIWTKKKMDNLWEILLPKQ